MTFFGVSYVLYWSVFNSQWQTVTLFCGVHNVISWVYIFTVGLNFIYEYCTFVSRIYRKAKLQKHDVVMSLAPALQEIL